MVVGRAVGLVVCVDLVVCGLGEVVLRGDWWVMGANLATSLVLTTATVVMVTSGIVLTVLVSSR